MSNSNGRVIVQNGGVSAGFLLFLVFLVLKLTGTITWSWWWVTCPLWIGFAILAAIGVVVLVFALIVALISAILK